MKYLTILTLMLFYSCTGTQYTPDNYPDRQVTFGMAGGFAGASDSYTLFENGQMYYKSNAQATPVELTKIDENMATQLVSTIESYNLGEIKKAGSINQNMGADFYNFLVYEVGDKKSRIQWAEARQLPNPAIHRTYTTLQALAKKNKQ